MHRVYNGKFRNILNYESMYLHIIKINLLNYIAIYTILLTMLINFIFVDLIFVWFKDVVIFYFYQAFWFDYIFI